MLEQSKTTSKIDEAIFDVQAKAPVIKKKSDNDYYRSKYAEYPDIQTALKPLLTEAKLQVKSFPIEGNKLIFIITHLPSQEYYRATVDLNSVSASPQAQGSAITYMKRYALVAALDLIIEGDDDDGNSSSNKTQTNQQQPTQTAGAAPVLPWLNKDTREWVKAKDYIFNAGKTIKDIQKKFKINKANLELLPKMEPLKPGSNAWQTVTIFVHDGMKPESVIKMFEISDEDMQDLLIDATNYTPAPKAEIKPTEANTTK